MTPSEVLSGALCEHKGECVHWTPRVNNRWSHPNASAPLKTAQALYLQFYWMGMPAQRADSLPPKPAKLQGDISEEEKERLRLAGEL